jgi:hypothetical protein
MYDTKMNSKLFNKAWLLTVLLAFCMSANLKCSSGIGGASLSDTTVPAVILTHPEDGATNVPFNRALTVSFSEEMNAVSINLLSFTVTGSGGAAVTGAVALDVANRIATFTPATDLDINTLYTATITVEAEDLAGNPLDSDYVWEFTTGATADVTAPTVILTNPADFEVDVAINASINATFSEEIASASLTTDSFTVIAADMTPVSGAIFFNSENNIATFVPDDELAINSTYTATITTAVEDLSGNPLASDVTWDFSTGTRVADESINLGSNNAFAILAGSTVTSTGLSTINGDLGVSPGTAVTGFPPGILNGGQHAGDSAAAQAMLDLTDAYNEAAGRSTAPVTVSGNLGGMTLTPGLYKSTSSLEITSGDLTLDAQGDANAVFVFQMASTLTTTVGRQVILSGGAKAANIYWQVGTSATLGTNSVFKGNILADQSITLTTGAVLEGRALTRIGAVALDANTVTVPTP